jgi:hypothetical protein
MAANPKDPRTKRRAAMGDDPNKMAISPQPLPGMPQDGKGGNMMNYPMVDVEGQMGQKIGGPASMPYGDMGLSPNDGRLGNVGFTGNSGTPQSVVPGRGKNSIFAYNTQPQPNAQQQSMMEPLYDKASAEGLTMPNGINNNQPVSYFVSAMGPTGADISMGITPPGSMSPMMTARTESQLGLQGVQSAEAVTGLNTGRGGGRNKGTN